MDSSVNSVSEVYPCTSSVAPARELPDYPQSVEHTCGNETVVGSHGRSPVYAPTVPSIKANQIVLPGQGEPGENCARIRRWVGCRVGSHKKGRHPEHTNCGKWTCPVCHDRVAKRKAKVIAERLEKLADDYRANGYHVGEPVHISLSLDHEKPDVLDREWEAGFQREATRILEAYSKGVWGGVLPAHPWRLKHLDGSLCEDEDCRLEHQWEWGSHVHFIGYGWFERGDTVYEETGWVLRKIPSPWGRDIEKTVAYQLTHHGIAVGQDGKVVGQTYPWVGFFSTNGGGRVPGSKRVTEESCDCPECSEPMVETPGENEPDQDALDMADVYLVRRVEYDYRISRRMLNKLKRGGRQKKRKRRGLRENPPKIVRRVGRGARGPGRPAGIRLTSDSEAARLMNGGG